MSDRTVCAATAVSVCDDQLGADYCIHKRTKVKTELIQRPRFHIHYIPTHLRRLAQSDAALVCLDHAAGDREGKLNLCHTADRQNRTLCSHLLQ